MKQKIILWLGAIIITFLSGYMQSVSSKYYPVSGTIGIDAQKVSFKLDRIYRGNEGYKLIIRSDVKNLKGEIIWRRAASDENWKSASLNEKNGILTGTIPDQMPRTTLQYQIKLRHNGKYYYLPEPGPITILFLGKVPFTIMLFSYAALFIGLLLAVRTGLEYFNENPRFRLHSLFAMFSFISYAFIFNPVKRSYELGGIGLGKNILPITQVFSTGALIVFVIWLAVTIGIFNSANKKYWAAAGAILILILFQIIK